MEWSLGFITEADFKGVIENAIGNYGDKFYLNPCNIVQFHIDILRHINGCIIPKDGNDVIWDIVYNKDNGIVLPDGDIVYTLYIKIKDRLATIKSEAERNNYIIMQDKLLDDNDCACFEVATNAQKSQNIKWEITVDGRHVSHKRIRRVSIDQFYAIITGEKDAFYNMCMVLPEVMMTIP